jgi:phenylpyruvate tautomerase PptA (4-oxalocrotonate tautomerase family)
MPVAYLDLPSGLGADTKKKLVKEVADSIHHAYMIPDTRTRVFLREWPTEQMSVDGQLGSPMRPICDFVVPPGLPARRNGSSLSGSALRLPRHATCRKRRFRSQAARKSARDGYSPSSVSIRLSGPHSTTSWRSRIPWFSKARRQENAHEDSVYRRLRMRRDSLRMHW